MFLREFLPPPSFEMHVEAFAGGDDLRLRNNHEVQWDAVGKMPDDQRGLLYWVRLERLTSGHQVEP